MNEEIMTLVRILREKQAEIDGLLKQVKRLEVELEQFKAPC